MGKKTKKPDLVVSVCESESVSVCVCVGVGVGGIRCNAKSAFGLNRVGKRTGIIVFIFFKSVTPCPGSVFHWLFMVFLCPAHIGSISAFCTYICVP